MRFSKELYPKIALLKSAYSFTDRAYVHLDADDEYYYVELNAKDGQSAIGADDFANEMIAQCVRHEVYQQTKTLRELLVARAMASTVIQTQPKPTEHDAYNGFLQNEQCANSECEDSLPPDGEDELASQILSDWFEAYGNANA
ncbi:MAG: His-Xaa-Ser system protein HxsD [Eggerthellaceae bacterium]|nr:His-Xaa-Ser system protein HxsD [Eggerthellaceae bacterium]